MLAFLNGFELSNLVIGLACLIIGETIVGRGAMFRGAIAVVAGSILYRLVYALGALHQGGASGLPQAGDRFGGGPGHRGPLHPAVVGFPDQKAPRPGRAKGGEVNAGTEQPAQDL